MNTLQLIESIQQVFPNLSRNQIRLDLDSTQKLLASEVGSEKTRGSLASPSSNFAWSLPTGFIGLDDVTLYNSNNEPLYLGDFNYKYEIEFDKLFVYSRESTPITGLDSSISSAYIHYRSLPSTLSTESTSMEVEEQFRDAIESYVLGKYFAKFPIDTVAGNQIVKILNLQAAQLHKNEYEKLRIKLKKYLGSQVKTSGEAQFYDAGNWQLPRRPNDSTSGSTVSITAIADLYSKYAYYKIPYPGAVADEPQTPVLNTGYSTISCSLTGNEITLTSTAEFDEEGMIVINNWDATWVRKSSSEIVITAPSGWTTLSFEIYERS